MSIYTILTKVKYQLYGMLLRDFTNLHRSGGELKIHIPIL